MTPQTLKERFRYSHTIGRLELAGMGFREPVALARDTGDRIYVVSRAYEGRPDARRVTILTVEEDYLGEFARDVTTRFDVEVSAGDGFFIWPTSIAIDREGNVYLADEAVNRITTYTRDGTFIGKWGTPGQADGEIDGPSGLAIDKDDNLYLVDGKNHRVQKFTKEGKFLLTWGREGQGDGEFNQPYGIDIDSHGDVYVADWRNDRIQKFSPEGQFLMKFGNSGTGDGEFKRPTGVAVDQEGIIYVADYGNDRLQVFDFDGQFVTKMTGDATISKWAKQKLDANAEMWKEREEAHGLEQEKRFWGPIAVDVDGQGRVFVLELPRHRIQVYRKLDL